MEMEMIRITIKGTRADAEKAMAERGLSGSYVDESHGRTFWDVPHPAQPVLVSWYCELATQVPDGGFPAGTLLFYN